ncbi:MAG: elongation factor 1-beta [Halobacteriales archaeon]
MGDVAAEIKVMPQDPELDLDALEDRLSEALPEGAEITGFDREDVAFGLVALLPTVVVPDDAGGTEAIEEAFAEVEGVESVSVGTVTRI